ncbi:MAG: aldo/keto reductase [Desulfosarcinaceae bacterium]|nr:aldo/keto reductase [Desulfosarcinaceae bacterium]
MLRERQLGTDGPLVGALGYGAMVLEGYYGASEDPQAVATLQAALEMGYTMIDSADAYGNGHNEILVGHAIRDRRGTAFVATKFGIVFESEQRGTALPTGWGFSLNINGRPSYARQAVDNSLKRLGLDTIDLWYLHYPDPDVAIEESVGAMAEAVTAGKVRHLGLSNVTADQIRRAHAVHPICAVQFEYSLWRRAAESDLLPTLRELGIALVPWSPLGSGFLTGTVASLPEGDFRHNNPRFSDQNLQNNQDRFAPVKRLAATLELTPAQLALAWLLHQGGDIVPIPGTRSIDRLTENAVAVDVALDGETMAELDRLMPPGSTAGATLV